MLDKRAIIGILLMVTLPLAYAISVEDLVYFIPRQANTSYITNDNSTANTIEVNATCVIIDGNTTLNGVDLCQTNGGTVYINFTSTTTTSPTTTTTTTTRINNGRAIIDLTDMYDEDMNVSSLSELCIKIYKIVCFNFTTGNWTS